MISPKSPEIDTTANVTSQLRQTEAYLSIINEFAALISSLNQIDDIVWAIAKYVIARLKFVDCVVYLVDHDKQILIQHAAHGPKNPIAQEILNPITIPFGKGIVGTVAETCEPERVSNTHQDDRYIVDDEHRQSELSIPMVHEGVIVGVIDSEHPEVDFFTEQHQAILMTIASLSAPRIAYIWQTHKRLALSEQRLLLKTEELSAALEQLTAAEQEAIEAKEAAETLSQAKSDFISNMSHELRTPLTGITGYAQLLLRNPNLEPAQEKGLTVINNSARHMATIIENILTYSKHEYHGVALENEPTDLSKFVSEVGEMVRLQASSKGLALNVEVPEWLPQVLIDPSRLRQALFNLLGNAIKFTAEGSVRFCVKTLPKRDAGSYRARFEVVDTGFGIPVEDIKRIFVPFEQAGGLTHQVKGTGLGLPISQQIISGLGGEIKVESRVGQGSRFWFDIQLPLAKQGLAEPAPDYSTASQKYKGDRRAILIVDDLHATRVLFRSMLAFLGFDVYEAGDGKQAIVMADAHQPDLILIDWLMPQMNGIETIGVLRKMPRYATIPIVVSSAYMGSPAEMDDMLAIADHFLKKPIDLKDLQACLTDLLDLEWGS